MKTARYALLLALLFTACTSTKKLIYFQGAILPANNDSVYKMRIYPHDILSINVFTINAEAYPYFSTNTSQGLTDNRSAYEKGFIVDDSGQVKLPLIGNSKIGGLTIAEATALIDSKYRSYIDEPIITIKKLNFKVTILGEVNKPGTYSIQNEQATLPEVLGLAGDLTQLADRELLRIIREENGVRKDFFVDLTKGSSLTAENYYVHPNDLIYVQPNKRRAYQNINPSVTLFTSLITTTIIVLTFIIAVGNQK
jgi:polysaccharide export outer membrane protein